MLSLSLKLDLIQVLALSNYAARCLRAHTRCGFPSVCDVLIGCPARRPPSRFKRRVQADGCHMSVAWRGVGHFAER